MFTTSMLVRIIQKTFSNNFFIIICTPVINVSMINYLCDNFETENRYRGFFMSFRFLIVIAGLLITLFSYSSDAVSVFYEETRTADQIIFYAANPLPVPCTLKLEFTELEFMTCDDTLPYTGVISGNSEKVPLVTLNVEDFDNYKFKYNFLFKIGDYRVLPDPQALYILPFEHGTKHVVSQGYYGNFSHQNEYSCSLDFEMDENTPVVCVRDGIVVDVDCSSDEGGPTEEFAKFNNYIVIHHSDGTMGFYLHLRKEGSLVELNQHVKTGEIIGYSGNTGWSEGPHLHFEVRIPEPDLEWKSIPVKFLLSDGSTGVPQEGKVYYSTHPEKPSFDVIIGDDIKNEDYRDYQKKISLSDLYDIRIEKIDRTILLFGRNGSSASKNVKVKFDKLDNMISSVPEPRVFSIPPLTEKFLLFIRVDDFRKDYEYSYTHEWY